MEHETDGQIARMVEKRTAKCLGMQTWRQEATWKD